MLFSSYAFILCFLPLFLIAWEVGGRLFPDWPNIRGLILFAFSFLFYSLWGIPSLILLCCMVCLNYGLGQILAHAAREESRLFRWRKWLFAGAVALNIAPLAWFKYSLFIMENIALIIGADWRFTPPELPIGISFYTFIQIAWLAGIYKGEAELGSLWRHGLFSCCFPYVVSGPIVRQSQMGWQFDRLCAITAPNLAAGIALFCAGLAKKVLLADNAGFYADAVFNAAARNWPFNGLEAWLGSFFYTFQLYFDFSGYTDMALAIGIMVGLRLPENFNSPYKATCIVDFWHRWHITLSTWLRDFLYIPLGGNRHGKARQYLNLFLTMLIGGAWHGAGWTYIVWGGLHGLMLCVNHAWRLVIRDSPLEKLMASLPLRLACICLTFFCLNLCWVVFRAPSLDCALEMYAAMFTSFASHAAEDINAGVAGGWQAFLPNGLFTGWQPLALLALCAIICWFMPNSREILQGGAKRAIIRWRPTRQWAVCLALLAFVCLAMLGRQSTFLYFQF